MSEPLAGFGHVDWEARAKHWHRAHDELAKERDALRVRVLSLGEESLSLIGDLRAEVRRLRREAREANRDFAAILQRIREKARLCYDCDGRLEAAPDICTTISVRGKTFAVCARCAVIRARGIRRATVLEGPSFDWAEAEKAAAAVVDDAGEINWRAAANADPGVMACPSCGVHHWREGELVRCANCSTEWRP